MKKVGIFAVVTLAMLIALVAYSLTIIGEYQDLENSLSDDYVAAAKELQTLDERYPAPATSTLSEKRFAEWIAVRTTVAELLPQRFEDKFHRNRTRNLALAKLVEELDAHSMGISEYCAISARWRALLARAEFAKLQGNWRETASTQSNPERMQLPPPATNVNPAELALVKNSAARLAATMKADTLSILLDPIANGEIPESAKPSR